MKAIKNMVGLIAMACVAEGAFAACNAPATQVTDAALTNLLNGNTVCAARGGDRWQEEHQAGGALWDYKLGDADPVDPRTQVGTWSVTEAGAASVVTYDYGAGSQSYEVWDDGGSYSFCQAGVVNLDNATVVPGINVGCP